MNSAKSLIFLAYLNGKEASLREIQTDIDRARKKYFDVPEIQLKMDRRQAALDVVKKRVAAEKAEVMNPYYTSN